MAFQRPYLISLKRGDAQQSWGFRLKDIMGPEGTHIVDKVFPDTLAERAGLRSGDEIIQVGRINVQNISINQVYEIMFRCGNRLEMFVVRSDLNTSEVITQKQQSSTVYQTEYDNQVKLNGYSSEEIINPDYKPQKKVPPPPPPKPKKRHQNETPPFPQNFQVVTENQNTFQTQSAPTPPPRTSSHQISPKAAAPAPNWNDPQFGQSQSNYSTSSHLSNKATFNQPSGISSPPVWNNNQQVNFAVSQQNQQNQSKDSSKKQTYRTTPPISSRWNPQQHEQVYTSSVEIQSPTKAGSSPSFIRKIMQSVWPPKKSTVRDFPRTGFSPTVMREQSTGKQCVWPPPKHDSMNGDSTPPYWSPPPGRRIMWNPSPSPPPTSRVPFSSPQLPRRKEAVWPPPQVTRSRENIFNPHSSPIPSRKITRFDDHIKQHSISGVPPTYRAPPSTQHVESNWY